MPPTTRATLIEVANVANTSKTSVSRYFGPERHKLSPALQARIKQAADALHYQPNLMARGLKGGGSRLLGMLVADIRNPFSVAIVHGVEVAARKHGYALIVCNTDNDPDLEQRHLASLAAYQVEGLVVNAAGQPQQLLQTIMRSGLPLVLIDREVGEISAPVIGLDNALAIDMALNHLSHQGYRCVLYVSEAPEQASARQERLQRFQQQSASLGLDNAILTSLEEQEAIPALRDFIQKNRGVPCAVLCANGNATLAMTRCFQHLEVAMGEVGLIGIDELDWCELVPPGITTLAQPTDAIGSAAVTYLLLQTLPSKAAKEVQHHHPPVLIPRGSTQLIGPSAHLSP